MIQHKRSLAALTAFIVVTIIALIASAMTSAANEGTQAKITLLNYDPMPARAGGAVDLRFRVENTGDTRIDSMQIEVLSNYPLTATSSSVQAITLHPYQTNNYYANLQYTMRVDPEAVNGYYQLKIRYRYNSGDWVVANYTIQVASKEFAQIIYVDRAQISPGTETPLNFTVTNTGNAPLQNLVFSWSDQKGYILPVYSDNTKYIKRLDPGDSVRLTYIAIADVNAPAGLTTLDLNLGYESASNATQSILRTKAGMFIGGVTDFDVAFSESSAGQTSLSVANTGNNPAAAVTVSLPDQQGYRVTGGTSSIIGNLNKGDYTLVSFQIAQRNATSAPPAMQGAARNLASEEPRRQSNMPGNQSSGNQSSNGNLNVLIQYTDTTGARQSVTKSVPIQFRGAGGMTGAHGQQQSSASIWSSTWLWGIVIVIAAAAGIVYYRKSKGKR